LKEVSTMVKLDIISGFLGAGKTTFINKLLSDGYDIEGTVLIENEFGDVSVDGELIQSTIEMVELTSGCICCTLQGDFIQGIRRVVEKFQPRRILIEPTGAANLKDVLTACEKAALHADVEINSIVTIANAQTLPALLEIGGEFFVQQLQMAKLLVMSGTQLLNAEDLNACRKKVETLNLEAVIHWEPWTEISAMALLSEAELLYQMGKGENSPVVKGYEKIRIPKAGLKIHKDHFVSMAIYPKRVFTEEEIYRILDSWKDQSFGEIFRGKGFLKTASKMVRAEYVLGAAVEIAESNYNKQPVFIIIGQSLDEKKIRLAFDA
jgi:G3E family GTPase